MVRRKPAMSERRSAALQSVHRRAVAIEHRQVMEAHFRRVLGVGEEEGGVGGELRAGVSEVSEQTSRYHEGGGGGLYSGTDTGS